jgi:hypothetical protein
MNKIEREARKICKSLALDLIITRTMKKIGVKLPEAISEKRERLGQWKRLRELLGPSQAHKARALVSMVASELR